MSTRPTIDPTAQTTPSAEPAADTSAETSAGSGAGRPRLSVSRGVVLGFGCVLVSALPVVWGIGAVADLVTGTEPDHRFHQLTGQGLLLAVLWLGGLAPLVVAGFRRRRPSPTAGLRHLCVVVGGAGAAALAPGNGGVAVAGVLLVTGGVLWAALPVRPDVAGVLRRVDLDPVLAPIGLLVTAVLTPYLLSQAAKQRAMVDEHAKLSHYFDMTWLSLVVVLFVLLAAALPAARGLATWAAGALLVLGSGALLFTDAGGWPVAALVLGIAAAAVGVIRSRFGRPAPRVAG